MIGITILFGLVVIIATITSIDAFYVMTASSSTSTTVLHVLWDPRNSEDAEIGSTLVDFPTPAQRTEIKKEAAKRKARKQLHIISFPTDETDGPWSFDTYQKVWNILLNDEMVELKGISHHDKKHVYQKAKAFCEEIEELVSSSSTGDDDDETDGDGNGEEEEAPLPVALLSVKGHTALIYCPTLPLDHPAKLRLRTSVGQKNVWKARPKPFRDISGKVIKTRRMIFEEEEEQ
jgi:hypothetical protein